MRLATLVVGLALPATQQEKNWEEYLPLRDGNQWLYVGKQSGADVELARKIAGKKKVKGVDCVMLEIEEAHPEGGRTYSKYTKKLYLKLVRGGIQILDAEPAPYKIGQEEFLLKFPLEKGQKWGNVLTRTSQINLIEVEEKTQEVRVPAGTFTCKVLAFEFQYTGVTVKHKWYLARGTGFVKIERVTVTVTETRTYTTTEMLELKEFTKGK